MEKFDFLEWAIKNGYGKIEIPNNILGLILKFENKFQRLQEKY
jgi:hypothetical protein